MKFVVKNTTQCGVLDLLCPHSCRGCGCLGSVLCECCKKNFFLARRAICPICKCELRAEADERVEFIQCSNCKLEGVRAMLAGGWREGALEKLVEQYKYQSIWAIGEVLAEILDESLPKPEAECWREMGSIVVVPLPTIGRHVRERGLDHTLRVARKLAKRRGWKCMRILSRAVDTVQVGAKAAEREEQAQKSYEVRGKLDARKTYLLLDDVWTTGASMRSAVRTMKMAGVKDMIAMVVAVGRPREVEDSN